MKKIITIIALFIAINSNAQKPGKYYVDSYKSSESNELKTARNTTISVTLDDITVSVGSYNPIIYTIISKENDVNNVVFLVTGTDGNYYQFIIGPKGDSYGIMYSESRGYIYYSCPSVIFY